MDSGEGVGVSSGILRVGEGIGMLVVGEGVGMLRVGDRWRITICWPKV